MVSVDFGVLEEGSVFDFLFKVRNGEEEVISAIDFAWAGGAGGAGDGIVGEPLGGEAATEGGFPRARGAGDEVKNAGIAHEVLLGGSRILFWTKSAQMDRLFGDDLGLDLGG